MKTYILGNVSKYIGFLLIYSIRKCFRIYKFASLPPNILGNLSEFVLTVLHPLQPRQGCFFRRGSDSCWDSVNSPFHAIEKSEHNNDLKKSTNNFTKPKHILV